MVKNGNRVSQISKNTYRLNFKWVQNEFESPLLDCGIYCSKNLGNGKRYFHPQLSLFGNRIDVLIFYNDCFVSIINNSRSTLFHYFAYNEFDSCPNFQILEIRVCYHSCDT